MLCLYENKHVALMCLLKISDVIFISEVDVVIPLFSILWFLVIHYIYIWLVQARLFVWIKRDLICRIVVLLFCKTMFSFRRIKYLLRAEYMNKSTFVSSCPIESKIFSSFYIDGKPKLSFRWAINICCVFAL